jgi:hypothetical protein
VFAVAGIYGVYYGVSWLAGDSAARSDGQVEAAAGAGAPEAVEVGPVGVPMSQAEWFERTMWVVDSVPSGATAAMTELVRILSDASVVNYPR